MSPRTAPQAVERPAQCTSTSTVSTQSPWMRAASCVRFSTCSFLNVLDKWKRTVGNSTPISLAICLSGQPIKLPPLKERRDDIPLLMQAFLAKYCELHKRDIPGFTHRAVQALLQYEFPGNIRELQNLVERGVIMAEEDEPIDLHHLFRGDEPIFGQGLSLNAQGQLVGAEPHGAIDEEKAAKAMRTPARRNPTSTDGAAYRKALVAARYNVSEAARQLGLSRAQLSYRLKRFGIL